MNILMLLEGEFPPDIRVQKEILTLQKNNHTVYVACYTRENRKSYEKLNNLIIYRKAISPIIYKSSIGCLKFPLYFSFWRSFINELFTKIKFDAIHVHDLPLAKIGIEIKLKYNIPFILDLHENWPANIKDQIHTNTFLGKILSSNNQWEKYQKEMTQNADKIIVVIDEMKTFLSNFGIKSDKIHIVSNTVNYDLFKIAKLKPNPEFITLFYSGGINYNRGLQFVLESINIINEKVPNIRFWIVGFGSYRKNIENLIKKLKLKDKVKIFGKKPLNEMGELLAQSDITLIPHKKNLQRDTTIPNKLFEYMYAGKPVISSNVITVKRILDETKAGLTYNHKSSIDLAKKLIHLINNPTLMNKMGINGKKAINIKYNWNITSAELLNVYNNI